MGVQYLLLLSSKGSKNLEKVGNLVIFHFIRENKTKVKVSVERDVKKPA